ncbi:hypothetical protein QP157_15830 [Sphingomonas sp. LR61]
MPKTIVSTTTIGNSSAPMTTTLRMAHAMYAIATVMWKFSATRVCSRMKPPRSRSTRYATSGATKLKKIPPMWVSVAQRRWSSGLIGCGGVYPPGYWGPLGFCGPPGCCP